MNKYLILLSLFCLACLSTLSAQNEPDSLSNDIEQIELSKDRDGLHVRVQTVDSIGGAVKDTTKIKMKNSTIYIVNDERDTDLDSIKVDNCVDSKSELTNWAGFDLGINGFLSADGETDLGDANEYLELEVIQSRTFSFNFWEHKARIASDYFGIITGMGLQYNSYRLKNDYTLASGKDTLVAFMDSTIDIRKNKFRTTWLNVPLLLEFNTSRDRDKSFHIAAGVVGGLHLGSMYKQKYSQEGTDFKVKAKNDFQVAPYKLEAMLRIGYGSVNLFASYQLTELFEEGHGPELYPYTLGITLAAF
jgi:hypothetical protein